MPRKGLTTQTKRRLRIINPKITVQESSMLFYILLIDVFLGGTQNQSTPTECRPKHPNNREGRTPFETDSTSILSNQSNSEVALGLLNIFSQDAIVFEIAIFVKDHPEILSIANMIHKSKQKS
ncbi:hypothetical protein F8M41_007701 [Gigaspora margarita]|uniref:Uncharacterized protein n=1 Tax=Gigaspora margarita TaxID=4874 RepID=A0A8H4A353_GIGMA|nr:hypothetical protein F8M41_007701 [Gigaspora margarita]